MRNIREKVKKTIIDLSMIEENTSVLLCVSGGMDSATLLDIFSSLTDELKLKVAVCHLNHNLRGAESVRDQEFVEKAAEKKGLKFYTSTLKEGELDEGKGGLQERAREARYAFFTKAALDFGATCIALAHTKDDQSETVLMRVLKGAGIKGLRGMPAVRGPYIRPLLEVTRAEIEAYAKERGVEFVEDSSNESTKYQRNKLRLELIPELQKEYNTAIKDALVTLSKSAERDYSFIESEARALFCSAKVSEEESRLVLSGEELNSMHPALSTRVFLMAVEELKGDAREFYSVHVEAFLKLIKSAEPGASVDLPGGLTLRREYEQVVIESSAQCGAARDVDNGYEVVFNGVGVTKLGKSGSIFTAEVLDDTPEAKGASGDVAFFDLDILDSIDSPLSVRCFRPGDTMTPMGMSGAKKVQDIFVDDKVARLKRAGLPFLVSAGEVLWIAGHRQSETAKLTPKTKRTLRVEYKDDRTD